jgi:glycosyltransferase involved in cell wall biosynthesis
MGRELISRGHSVDFPSTAPDAGAAAATGHQLADRWAGERPDVALALGWAAALSAHVGARLVEIPVVIRLSGAGREPGSDRDRLELALARGTRWVLVPSAGELDRLVDRGVRRSVLGVLPEAVDRRQFIDMDAEVPAGAGHRVAVARPDGRDDHHDHHLAGTMAGRRGARAYEIVPVRGDGPDAAQLADQLRSVHAMVLTGDSDAEVALALRAMSCAVPIVALATGTLADIVADRVTGVLVRQASDIPAALRSLLADPVGRQGMGLAAVDRVRARFDTAVVGATLEAVLLEALPRHVAVAS